MGTCLFYLCLQLSFGLSHANQQGCGIWYMCGVLYPHDLDISTTYVELGVERENWRALLSYDGRYAINGVVGPEANSTFAGPGCAGAPSASCPAQHLSGVGKEQNFCGEYLVKLGQHWRIETGPCLYHVQWVERSPDLHYWNGSKFVLYPTYLAANKWNPGAVLGVNYKLTNGASFTTQVKMCDLRGIDQNANSMPSICRAVLGEAGFRFQF